MRIRLEIRRGFVAGGTLLLLAAIGGALAGSAPATTLLPTLRGLDVPAGRAAPAAEIEPNDSIFQASGVVPIDGVRGALQTSTDVDTFALRLRPQRQVTFNYTLGSGCGDAYSVRFSLETPEGDGIGAHLHVEFRFR